MPARLVYAPKAWVFTRQHSGQILNLTDYVTAGQVQRVVDQASTATVTLRNPNKMFTIPKSPSFLPMDGITIWLQRLAGFPVQVFTGYLDETPYYQMYPGSITISATCTLKRLVYSYFDPSLPSVNTWLSKYGWINSGTGVAYSTAGTYSQATIAQGKAQTLVDGGLAKLLWAALVDFGDWKDTNIWIENLPSGDTGIAARMAKLIAESATTSDDQTQAFTQFLDTVVGASSQGTGGGNAAGGGGGGTVNSPLLNSNQNTFSSVVSTLTGLDPAVVAAWVISEEPKSSTQAPNGANNWLNIGSFDSGNWSTLGGDFSTPTAGGQTTAKFLQGSWGGASTGIQNIMKTVGQAPSQQISAIQNSGWATSHYPNLPSVYQSIVKGGGVTASTSSTAQTGTSVSTTSPHVGGSDSSGAQPGQTQQSVINCITEAANVINGKGYPYIWGGGHSQAGTPSGGTAGSGVGFDCSGSVAAVLSAANIITPGSSVGADDTVISQLQSAGLIQPGEGSGIPEVTLYDNPGTHIYMRINGQFWGTWAGGQVSGSGGGNWQPSGFHMSGYNAYHFSTATLNQNTTYSLGLGTAVTTTPGGGSGTSAQTDDVLSTAKAVAFTGQLNWPTVQDMVTAEILGQYKRGLMHDQQLMPFIQQLANASMRHFQSLPNGDFFAFYPDYFGETGHRKPYWIIDDLEVLTGDIYLNDQTLVTHEYAVGDNLYPVNDPLLNDLSSAGAINIFNAFLQKDLLDTQGPNASAMAQGGMSDIMNNDTALAFLKRYGVRPKVDNFPMIRSQVFEMFMAYQQFMLAWAGQFRTPFSFTFMPELFPGGKVAFSGQGLMMYINSVTHTWDYSEGFTTEAELMAPSKWGSDNPDLPPNMVQALTGPVAIANGGKGISGFTSQKKVVGQKNAAPTSSSSSQTVSGVTQNVAKSIGQGIENILKPFTP